MTMAVVSMTTVDITKLSRRPRATFGSRRSCRADGSSHANPSKLLGQLGRLGFGAALKAVLGTFCYMKGRPYQFERRSRQTGGMVLRLRVHRAGPVGHRFRWPKVHEGSGFVKSFR